MLEDSDIQRIARLTPLADVLASFDLSIGRSRRARKRSRKPQGWRSPPT